MKINPKNSYFISEFYCTECGNQGIPLARRNGRKRENGHLKILYCCYCKKETNFVEIKPNSSYTKRDFKIEFSKGNFVKGNRKMTYKQCLSTKDEQVGNTI